MEDTMRSLLSIAIIASSLIISAAAQGQQPPALTSASKVTISGCIQPPAPDAATAGAPAAPGTSPASKFDLASAKMVGSTPVGTAGSTPPATRYRLEGDEKTISPHLNHQVEITGTVTPATGTGATANAAPMLKVDSLKMIAAKCS
jgi:hypothetical protein